MVMRQGPSCRLYGVLAREAPIVAIFRRGPSHRWLVLKWDYEKPELIPGGWFRGTLYPRRCSISPDGTLLHYFGLTGQWRTQWGSFAAISKLPWLTALAAWDIGSTWTSAKIFSQNGYPPAAPNSGTCPPFIKFDRPDRFFGFVGREDGWTASEENSERFLDGLPVRSITYPPKDGKPLVLISKSPLHGHRLISVCRGNDFGARDRIDQERQNQSGSWIEGKVIEYLLETTSGKMQPLIGVTWANWDSQSRLLLANDTGELQICRVLIGGALEPIWRDNVNRFTPDHKVPSPDWAWRW